MITWMLTAGCLVAGYALLRIGVVFGLDVLATAAMLATFGCMQGGFWLEGSLCFTVAGLLLFARWALPLMVASDRQRRQAGDDDGGLAF